MPYVLPAFMQTVQVQTAETLPTNDTGWTTTPQLIPQRGEEGSGQNYGNMSLFYRVGTGFLPGSTSMQTFEMEDWTGYYVRVLVSDLEGSISIGGKTYSVLWTGLCDEQEDGPDGSSSTPGGIQVLSCIGLAGILDTIFVNQGYVQGYNAATGSATEAYPLESPYFNALPTQFQTTLGERSASKGALGNSTGTAYYFDLVARSNPWSAADIVTYLLVGFGQPQLPPDFTPSGPTWSLNDPLNFLAYVPDKLDFDGKSVADCINMLINPRRGCTWNASVVGNAITINVYSCAASAITFGSFTLPASNITCSLDATDNAFIDGLRIKESAKSRFDYIEVRGAKPLIGMTLCFKNDGTGSLIAGWDTTYETGGSGAPQGAWDPSQDQGPAYEYIWRRFTLNPTWNGSQYNSSTIGLRNALNVNANGGYDGTRDFSTSSDDTYVPSPMLQLDTKFPLPYNFDYASATISTIDMTESMCAPMVIVIDSGGNMYDYSGRFHVEVEQNPPAVVLNGPVEELRDAANNGSEILVTIGIRESDPLAVSWNTDDAFSEIPRSMIRRLPYCEQWVALSGSVMGAITDTSAPVTLSANLQTVDDTAKLVYWLQVLQTWFGANAVTATWTDHSGLDNATGDGSFQPGSLMTSVNRGDTYLDSNSVVTARAWDFTKQGYGTTYTTERIIPDVVSVEGHPMIQAVRQRQQEIADA